MKFFVIGILVLATFVFTIIHMDSQKSQEEISKLKAASESSSAGGELLIFTASWCPPCKQMKANVYNHPDVAPFKDSLRWTFHDIDDRQSARIAQEYGVSGVPTFVKKDSSGKETGRAVGGMSVEDFVAFLK